MNEALLVLLVCAAIDTAACLVLVGFVWIEHRRVRREAASSGEHVASAAGGLGCLLAFCLLSLIALYAVAWFLLL